MTLGIPSPECPCCAGAGPAHSRPRPRIEVRPAVVIQRLVTCIVVICALVFSDPLIPLLNARDPWHVDRCEEGCYPRLALSHEIYMILPCLLVTLFRNGTHIARSCDLRGLHGSVGAVASAMAST